MPGETPEPPAKDLRTLIPEYAGLARETTLLNPEPGNPGLRESSLGGELLWPADEPWPYCAQEDHWTYGSDRTPHGAPADHHRRCRAGRLRRRLLLPLPRVPGPPVGLALRLPLRAESGGAGAGPSMRSGAVRPLMLGQARPVRSRRRCRRQPRVSGTSWSVVLRADRDHRHRDRDRTEPLVSDSAAATPTSDEARL